MPLFVFEANAGNEIGTVNLKGRAARRELRVRATEIDRREFIYGKGEMVV